MSAEGAGTYVGLRGVRTLSYDGQSMEYFLLEPATRKFVYLHWYFGIIFPRSCEQRTASSSVKAFGLALTKLISLLFDSIPFSSNWFKSVDFAFLDCKLKLVL